ncbi:MAG: hypothetical protein JJ855_11215 [Rhodospirillales bacterium]|nr:hypothetical protein [Rhodospirillales bacterium]
MKSPARRLSAVLVLIFALAASGCSMLVPAEGVSLMGTEKTLGDHLISLSSGKNCSTVRREQGLTYCEEDMPQIRQNIYCYRDLGGVTCYDKADPHGVNQNQQRVDRNDHNLPK